MKFIHLRFFLFLFLLPIISNAQTSFEVDNFENDDMGFTFFQSSRSYSAATSGDINGDGIEDLIFASDENGYVIYGDQNRENNDIRNGFFSTDLDSVIGFIINGISNDTDDGISLASGDVNGDGIDDIVMGLPGGGTLNAGLLHVIYGKESAFSAAIDISTLTSEEGFSVEGKSNSNRFGMDVAFGDINGDDLEDLLVMNDRGEEIFGLYGKETGIQETSILEIYDFETNYEDVFIISADWAGVSNDRKLEAADLDNDGFDDVIFTDPDGGFIGGVYGQETKWTETVRFISLESPNAFLIGSANNETELGFDLTTGDLNNDGNAEIIIGAPFTDYDGDNFSGEKQGIIYVVPGNSDRLALDIDTDTLSNIGGYSIVSARENALQYEIGRELAIGDVNQDGYDDLIVGSGTSEGRGNGETYIIFGKEELSTDEIELVNLTSEEGFTLFGERNRFDTAGGLGGRLVSAGDFNGDGFDDVVVGANIQSENDGTLYVFDNFTGITVSNENEILNPNSFVLNQNYPNPFNPSSTISFTIPSSELVRLEVFNMLGQKVATLVNEVKQSGLHSVNFDASQMSSGIYIYRLQAGEFMQTKKMMLIK